MPYVPTKVFQFHRPFLEKIETKYELDEATDNLINVANEQIQQLGRLEKAVIAHCKESEENSRMVRDLLQATLARIEIKNDDTK